MVACHSFCLPSSSTLTSECLRKSSSSRTIKTLQRGHFNVRNLNSHIKSQYQTNTTQLAITGCKLTNDEWTIDNKYYSANVEFIWEIKDTFEGFNGVDDEFVPPAIIWIYENDKVGSWSAGKHSFWSKIQDAFLELLPLLDNSSVEIKLVLSPEQITSSDPLNAVDSTDPSEDLDIFFVQKGFELVFLNTGKPYLPNSYLLLINI